jgi:hypothetical protein
MERTGGIALGILNEFDLHPDTVAEHGNWTPRSSGNTLADQLQSAGVNEGCNECIYVRDLYRKVIDPIQHDACPVPVII